MKSEKCHPYGSYIENTAKAIREKRQLSVSYSVPVSADWADKFFMFVLHLDKDV
jgi:hypothetical protein